MKFNCPKQWQKATTSLSQELSALRRRRRVSGYGSGFRSLFSRAGGYPASGAAPQLLLSFTTSARASRRWLRGNTLGKAAVVSTRWHGASYPQAETCASRASTYPRSALGTSRCFVQGLGAARPAAWAVTAGTGAPAACLPALPFPGSLGQGLMARHLG